MSLFVSPEFLRCWSASEGVGLHLGLGVGVDVGAAYVYEDVSYASLDLRCSVASTAM